MTRICVSRKLSAVLLVISLGLGFNSMQVSASLPMGGGPIFIVTPIDEEEEMIPNTQLEVDYQLLIYEPLDALIRRFTRDHAISITNGETTQVWIFRDEPQVAAIAERIRAVMKRTNDNISEPVFNRRTTSLIIQYQSFMFGLPQNATTAGTTGPSDEELRREMQEVNAEFEVINKELNKIPAHKPTKNDVKAGKCLECKLMDL